MLGLSLAITRPPSVLGVSVPPVNLTPTTMETSVTDPLTGHVYTFSSATEVGQYQDGTWFAVGGAGNTVSIASITPVSTSVSTAGYSSGREDQLDDTASTGARTRWMHGTMVNPWAGVTGRGSAPMGFDSYYGGSGTGTGMLYQHDQNDDPGRLGAPLTLTEGSVVKSESFTEEGGHSASRVDKTRLLKFSVLTVVPEVPAANSFRPPLRGTDKKSYWTTDQLNIAGNRQKITGFRPFTTQEISDTLDLVEQVQQTFAIYQEPASRWNPGARGGGVAIYGDEWYTPFATTFGVFHGDYTDAEIEDLVKATVQVGIDLYGKVSDGDGIFGAQAHHAGRKGIVFMAGLLLNNQDILDQCDYSQYPYNFGVDDAYCGYVTQSMIGAQGAFYKGAFPYKWEQEQLGLPEWSAVFAEPGGATVESEEQVADADLASRSYQVLSFDNGAMYQCLFGMISDPTAQYYNPAYFDFADRYLAHRFGDQIDGVWDASSNAAGTNNHFTGNWWSINPLDTTVSNFKEMRDACTRPNYVETMIPEPLPKPDVTHDGSSGYLDVDFNTNNFRLPQNKDEPITGYDLRWTAYAGGADTAASEAVDEYIGNFTWKVIEDITIPYQLSAVPRGLKAKVQIRMKNANGDGPWLDDIKGENYPQGSQTFSILAGRIRYSTNFDVPDIAAFNQIPINFKPPSATPTGSVISGSVATGNEGLWSENPVITNTEWKWRISDDGLTGWTEIPGATADTHTATQEQEGKFIQPGVRKTNSIGSSDYVYATAPVKVGAPIATELVAGIFGNDPVNPGVGALGGKRLLVMFGTKHVQPIPTTGSIGDYNFTAAEVLHSNNFEDTNPQRERQIFYQLLVPDGETAETIEFDQFGFENTVAVYELSQEVVLTAGTSADVTQTVPTVSGGAAFWFGRADANRWINFESSDLLVEHSLNPPQDEFALWSFAHALGVGNGSVTVTYAYSHAQGTRGTLISVQPAP